MTTLKRILDSRPLFALLLALPALSMLGGLLEGADPHRLLFPAGEFAARFTILALMVTPLRMIFPHQGWMHWLVRRRRYLGVAAFCYALAHTLLYVADRQLLSTMLEEAAKPPYVAGWIALLLFVPLAATSNDWSVRRLGLGWRKLQRLAYLAALLTLLHWLLIARSPGEALVQFAPLALLEAWRVVHNLQAGRRPRLPAG